MILRYIYEIHIILGVSLAGEILNHFIPIPVPASIYGLLIMFLLLLTGALKQSNIKHIADWFITAMPIMFIPGGVGIITVWDELKSIFVPLAVITVISLVITMGVTGMVTELVLKLKRGKRE